MNPDSSIQKIAESGVFGALCIVLLMFIWWLIREQNRKDAEQTAQIERINKEHTAQIERINAAHDANIEKVTIQFTTQIDRMAASAALDRKESTEAFNKLSSLLSSVIEKRGRVDMRDNLQ